MAEFNSWAQTQKDALENWGAPEEGSKYHVSDRVVKTSLVTIAGGAVVPATINFFRSGTQNTDLSSEQFPLNGKALDIHGIRVEHCLKISGAAGVENEMQQIFEATSRLEIRYRNRSGIFSAPLSQLVPSTSFLDGQDVVADAKFLQFMTFKTPIKYGATQPIDFQLTTPSSFTLLVAAAADAPVVPAGVGASYWIQLQLLCTEYSAS